MTSAIVLAGGASTRFGGDKLSAVLDDRSLLDHALEAVGAIANPVVVVIAPDGVPPLVPSALTDRVTVMRDAVAHRGPLAGLAAGLVALADIDRGNDDAAVVVGGDMPHLVPAVLELLAGAVDDDPAAGAAPLEFDPPCVLPLALRPSIAGPIVEALLREDRRALRGLLDRLTVAMVPAEAWRTLDPDGRTPDDVDTPADLERRPPGR